jgi:hypothetical protein
MRHTRNSDVREQLQQRAEMVHHMLEQLHAPMAV